MNEGFGKRLRRLREARSLTQRALARLVTGGERNALVSDWERGVVVPSPEHFFRLAQALEVSPLYLYSGTEPASPDHSRVVDLAFEIQARIADLARDERLPLENRKAVLEELVDVLREPLDLGSG